MPPWLGVSDGIRVFVRVTPKASRAKIGGLVALADGRVAIQVHVNAPAQDGKANAALLRLLAKSWRLPKTSLGVIAGTTSRIKTVHIAGDGKVLAADLAAWLDKMAPTRQ